MLDSMLSVILMSSSISHTTSLGGSSFLASALSAILLQSLDSSPLPGRAGVSVPLRQVRGSPAFYFSLSQPRAMATSPSIGFII